ncbi:MAG: flagellin, partial [Succinatimonas sp.]|nr:flagellin [Succinatimonas sp.]
MSIYVNTNVTSLNTTNKLSKATHSLDTTYKRLSSGYRINSAKDDAAGLQISDRLTSQINGLKQGNRNANDGIALAQTAEGALDEVHTMLQRIRTLSVQSANGTNTTKDREAIQGEVSQLCSEINRIACKTTFGKQEILSGKGVGLVGTDGKILFQVGANAEDTTSVSLSSGFSIEQMSGAHGGTDSGTLIDDADGRGGKTFDVSTAEKAQKVLADIDNYIGYVDKKRGEFGAVQNRLESTISN